MTQVIRFLFAQWLCILPSESDAARLAVLMEENEGLKRIQPFRKKHLDLIKSALDTNYGIYKPDLQPSRGSWDCPGSTRCQVALSTRIPYSMYSKNALYFFNISYRTCYFFFFFVCLFSWEKNNQSIRKAKHDIRTADLSTNPSAYLHCIAPAGTPTPNSPLIGEFRKYFPFYGVLRSWSPPRYQYFPLFKTLCILLASQRSRCEDCTLNTTKPSRDLH